MRETMTMSCFLVVADIDNRDDEDRENDKPDNDYPCVAHTTVFTTGKNNVYRPAFSVFARIDVETRACHVPHIIYLSGSPLSSPSTCSCDDDSPMSVVLLPIFRIVSIHMGPTSMLSSRSNVT